MASVISAPYPDTGYSTETAVGTSHGALSAWYLCPDDEIEFHAFDKTELTPAIPAEMADLDVQELVTEMKVCS